MPYCHQKGALYAIALQYTYGCLEFILDFHSALKMSQ